MRRLPDRFEDTRSDLRPICQGQFPQNVGDVVRYCAPREHERLRNLLVRVTTCDQFRDLALAWR